MEGHFSYKKLFHGNTLMVIVPHEDDEINAAGSVICGACREGMEVVCVFITNGDYKYLPQVRIEEAIRSLAVLGVPEKDVVFLGYPDGGLHTERCVYGRMSPVDVYSRTETEGAQKHPEFCAARTGKHHALTWENLLNDLENVLLQYQSDGIIAVDFDSHPDHRMCSIAFDTVMGRILNQEGNTYRPVVLKAFAYNTAFNGEKDFWKNNLRSTVINPKELTIPGQLDNPGYEWEKRLRIPVPACCRTMLLRDNVIYQALKCHLSQRAIHRADRIINGDQVFWRRNTRNLAFMGGRISVSSGESKYLHDFRMLGMRPLWGQASRWEDYLWIPAKEDTRPFCFCEFECPQTVTRVVFYGNLDGNARILKGRLSFNTGYSIETGAFQSYGKAFYVDFPCQKGVSWIRFEILERTGENAGISEWEILGEEEEEAPWIKICVGEHFAYRWLLSKEDAKNINAYCSGMTGKLRWYLDGAEMTIEDIREKCSRLKRPAALCAECVDSPAICDEVMVYPQTVKSCVLKWSYRIRNHVQLWLDKQREKRPHHKLNRYTYKYKMISETKG